MRKILVFALFLVFTSQVQAQEQKIPFQSVYLELGGAGLPYSFNYDFRFNKEKMDSWGMRVGVGGYATQNDSFFSLPLMVNKLYGKGANYFELGFGATIFGFDENRNTYCESGYYDQNGNYICSSYGSSSYEFILPVDGSPSVMGTLNIGYRRVPVNGGFTWRINMTPIFNNNGFWPLWLGVGFGYAF